MKFEKPIAEIQRFDLRDIISASSEETTEKSQPGTFVGDYLGGPCTYTKADNLEEGDCL